MSELKRLSHLEYLILQIMLARGASAEVYGFELVKKSAGALKLGTAYVTLGRMERKGYIASRKEKIRPGERGRPRRLYTITESGEDALRKWGAKLMSIIAIPAALL